METGSTGTRMVVYVKDIQRMSGCSYNTANDTMELYLKDEDIEGKNLSVGNFSKHSGLPIDEINENIRRSDADDKEKKAKKKLPPEA